MSAKISEVFDQEIRSKLDIGAEVEIGDTTHSTSDTSSSAVEDPSTDSDGYFVESQNDFVFGVEFAYEILEFVGRGSFGTVLKCSRKELYDGRLVHIDNVAVKVVRSGENGEAWAKHELKMLGAVQSAKAFCIQLVEFFKSDAHVFIVLELMEMSLRNYIEETEFDKMPLAVIRRVVSNVLQGLAKLKDLGIIHADIKPANIMINQVTYKTKLIDFGLADFVANVDLANLPTVQTRHYRAPEVILKLASGYGFPIDMWSLGCTMGEMLTYSRLYPGKCSYDMLRYIFDDQGLPKQDLIASSQMKGFYFTNLNTPKGIWKLKTPAQYLADINNNEEELEKLVIYKRNQTVALKSIHNVNLPDLNGEEQAVERLDRKHFADLLKKMLKIDQHKRISPEAALRHPFMTMTHLRRKRHLESIQRSYELMGRNLT